MTSFGAQMLRCEDGHCVIEAPIRPEASQQNGFAHAGLTFAIGDSAGGFATMSLLGEGGDVLTVEMKINLLAPARGERLRATGRVMKAGRRLAVVQCEVEAIDGAELRTVALLQGTMIPIRPGD